MQIYLDADNTLVADYPIATDTSHIQWLSNNIVSIKPTTISSAGTYYVLISSGAFVGVNSDQPYAGSMNSTTAYRFKVVNLAGTPQFPYGSSATDVDADAPISLQMKFNRPMQNNQGFIYVKRKSNDSVIAAINSSSQGAVAIDNTTLPGESIITIPLPLKLENSTEYYVVIDPGTFKDTMGNPYTGLTDKTVWTFLTEEMFDITPPAVVSFTPTNGGTLGQLNGGISIAFNEKVYAGTGNVTIKKLPDNGASSLFCSIPVYTSAVTIDAATGKIVTIKPTDYTCPAFVNGTSYKVEIGNNAFRDATGNYYAGVSGSWTFTAIADTVPPVPTTYSPAVSAVSVPLNTTIFSITFNEEVTIAGSSNGVLFPQANVNSVTNLSLSQDSDKKKVIFTKTGGADLLPSTRYAITVPNGVIKDIAGNSFAGILNPYQWAFDTSVAGAIPTLTKAEMEGSTIVLTYSDQLDTTKVPYASNFYVTVNNVSQPVSNVSITSNQVRVTLQNGVIVGQVVKISYYPDSYSAAKRIQSLQQKEAVSFVSRDVTNTADTTLPRPISGTAAGVIVTLNFNKTLAALANAAAKDQFYINWGGQYVYPSAIAINGSLVVLTLPPVTSTSGNITVNYSPSSYPLRDTAGNPVSAFSGFQVLNPNDTTPPTFTSAIAVGNKITLYYNEALRSNVLPVLSSYSVLVNGTAWSISAVAISNTSVELTLSQSVTNGSAVILSYNPSTNPVADLAGNPAAAINGYQITGVGVNKATLMSAVLNGSVLALNYSAALSNASIPYTSQYSVKADGNYVSLANVSVSGSQVFLTLSSAVTTSQRLTVSYFNSGNSLKDLTGQIADTFTDFLVSNQSTNSGLPDYLESNGSNGYRMNSRAVSTSSSQTASGRTAKKYTVDGDKLTAAFTLLKTASGISTPRITLQVPSTEAGAVVSVPIKSIVDSVGKVSNGIVTVEYDGSTFDFPLNALSYTQLVQASGNNIANAQIVLKIERTTNAALSSLVASQGGQVLGSMIDFSAFVNSNGTEKEITEYEKYVNRSITVNSSGSTTDIAVVRLDVESGDLNYVPTRIESSGSTIKVNFSRKGNSTYAVVKRSNFAFNDMTTHWARADVNTLASKFIVEGTAKLKFDPAKSITRADFAEYIARGMGLTGNRSAASKYKDIGMTGTVAAYIGAVSTAGIVQGDSSGKFRPNDPITREEMATILVRAMKYAGYQTSPSSTALNSFKDKSKISSWAKDGVAISVTAGFIKGNTPTTVNPKANATRAEAAIMIKRFLEYVDFL
ncbi:SwmB domain-containing protein [Cohnella soli]|uniref:SwmB domain-containing protein n=1 Tax=Cohnella soli TaxID=425005 RepID=A0ABW0HMZ5_9BACL